MNRWQGLSAFVVAIENVSDQRLDRFAAVGGRTVAPVVYNDHASGPYNREHLISFRDRCAARGIQVWAWCNAFGGDPRVDAMNMAQIVSSAGLEGVIVDAEAAYQWPTGRPDALPILARMVRTNLPTSQIGITTNALNNSGIWNGRTLTPPQSMIDLNIRVIPQWYTWMYLKNGADGPEGNMKWLKEYGHIDGNFKDKTGANGRGVPLSYVRAGLECTGLEGSDLADGLARTTRAKQYGFTWGLWLYTLDSAPDSDFALLEAVRGKLFLT